MNRVKPGCLELRRPIGHCKLSPRCNLSRFTSTNLQSSMFKKKKKEKQSELKEGFLEHCLLLSGGTRLEQGIPKDDEQCRERKLTRNSNKGIFSKIFD